MYEDQKDVMYQRYQSQYGQDVEFDPALNPSDKADFIRGDRHYRKHYHNKPKYNFETVMRKFTFPKPSDHDKVNPTSGGTFASDY